MKRYLVLTIVLLFAIILKAQEQQVVVPYTLADRDHAIRLEAKMEANDVKMEALESKMNVKFDSIQKQLDQLSLLFYWGFGILITFFIFMLGYMIWDRRTALQPALDKAADADAKSTNLIRPEYSGFVNIQKNTLIWPKS